MAGSHLASRGKSSVGAENGSGVSGGSRRGRASPARRTSRAAPAVNSTTTPYQSRKSSQASSKGQSVR